MSGISPQAEHFVLLHLSAALRGQLWEQARQAAPQECVGLVGGVKVGGYWHAKRLWALKNVAAHPETQYLADPQQTWQAFRELRAQCLELLAVYHSHPRGPAHYSASDQAQAAYDVPYLIADLRGGELLGYWLPSGVAALTVEDGSE